VSVGVASVEHVDRQLVPVDLAEMAPGPGLAAVLAGIDRSRLNGYDLVVLLQAQQRQVSYEQAELLSTMAEIAHCPPGDMDSPVARRQRPDQDACDEVAMALTLTRRSGEHWLHTALDLTRRLPAVHAALLAGAVDLPKARVFLDGTYAVDEDVARAAVDRLIGAAPELTTRQLAARLRRMVILPDPDAAKKRYENSVKDRRVVGRQWPDGTAMLAGHDLPPDRVAAVSERLHSIAKAAKAAGDTRTMDQIKADAFLDILNGSYTGPGPQHRRGVVELTVPLTTLMGLSEEPGELAGWEPVIADIARQVAEQQRQEGEQGPEWRFSVTDPDTGLVNYHGATRRRPTKAQSDRIAARDRRCRAPGCRMPAGRCQDDHTIDYARGGLTIDPNIGKHCIHHHGLKSKGKVHVSQMSPGYFIWTTALGHTHIVRPEPPYG
jgi:hypothetical protein